MTGGIIFCLDRLTKLLAVRHLQLSDSVPVLKGYFDITLVHNTGAAFGFMAVARQSLRLPFLLITAALRWRSFYISLKGPRAMRR